jgi:hypothetical protein
MTIILFMAKYDKAAYKGKWRESLAGGLLER